MGWSVGYDSNWSRDVGYGVPAYCDHPKCKAEIDRGLGYICGDGPYGESDEDGQDGCGLFFCDEHGGGSRCPRCRASKAPYKRIKPEHPQWLIFKLNDHSWKEWRDENPEEVANYREQTQGIPVSRYFTQEDFTPEPEPTPVR